MVSVVSTPQVNANALHVINGKEKRNNDDAYCEDLKFNCEVFSVRQGVYVRCVTCDHFVSEYWRHVSDDHRSLTGADHGHTNCRHSLEGRVSRVMHRNIFNNFNIFVVIIGRIRYIQEVFRIMQAHTTTILVTVIQSHNINYMRGPRCLHTKYVH